MSVHSLAPWLPKTSQPPHDPRRLPLNHRVGWHLAGGEHMEEDLCGQLRLSLQPDSQRSLFEANGSLGGLQLPKYLAYTPDCGVLLLDREEALLKKFDPCECRFDTVPCTGGKGSDIRQFNEPQAIAICGDNVLIADSGNGRLLVYSLLGFLVRGSWSPPSEALTQLWQPVDIALSLDRKVWVADPANGCVHVFNFAGRWLKAISGVGAVSAIAVDQQNRLYVVVDSNEPVSVYLVGEDKKLAEVTTVREIEDRFVCSDIACSNMKVGIEVNAKGWFNLGWLCDRYKTCATENGLPAWFDISGKYLGKVQAPEKKYQVAGVAYSKGLDSRLYRCQWDRLSLKAEVPKGTRIKISTYSAETELSDKQVQALTEDQWLTQQWVYPQEKQSSKPPVSMDWDCLIRSAPGRFLWLRIEMSSDSLATPSINAMELDFPRISLARYLPAAFSAEAQSADFTERFLGIFDRGFRQIEGQIDSMAALFDPLSAPADAGKKDFLSWLASWIGVTLDRQLPLSVRRRLVKSAGHLYRCRGTLTGLRHILDIYLGFSSRRCKQTPDCRPCSVERHSRSGYQWQMPQMVLEHFVLRRWLFIGCARLGEQARLWGQKIVNRSQLRGEQIDGNAQLGVTQLNTRQDPLRDPFHVYAHKFSVFLPAWVGREDSYRRCIERLIKAEKPAHSQADIVYVAPRFRVGIQSMIGFDSVIGCYPQGITLDSTLLGKASVLSEQNSGVNCKPQGTGLRIGDKSTIGTTTRLA